MHHEVVSLGRLLSLTLLLVLIAVPPAYADPAPTSLALTATSAHAGQASTVTVTLTDQAGTPLTGAPVTLQRRVDGAWSDVAQLTTDASGSAGVDQVLARDARDNRFRASYAGDETHAAAEGSAQAALVRRASTVTVTGPDSVVDEQSVTLTVTWRAATGEPVRGRVELFRRLGGGDWKRVARLRTDEDGTARYSTRPREDSRWRAEAPAIDWVEASRSAVHRIDNLPPGVPVALPAGAPKPRVTLPDQPHATGAGAHPRITRIPTRIWNQMTGRTWHTGCPVGRAGLRLLRINYWDFEGYRRRGELVAATGAIDNMRGALVAMYRRQLPLRSMYRVDRFGWSARLHGANDYRSMAAGNTSAFNCRGVVGSPGVRSPHAYGRALDVNTWENPYHSRQGWTPNLYWPHRSHARVAWRSGSHPVVAIMRAHGFRWTYGTEDSQHFDVATGHGRTLVDSHLCDPGVCD